MRQNETFVPATLIAYLITLSLEKENIVLESLGYWIQKSLRTIIPK